MAVCRLASSLQHRAARLLVRGERLVARDDGAGASRQQFLGPLQLNLGQHLGRLAALERAFRLLHRGLEQPLFDAVERCAFLDQVAFLEQDLFEIARHARPDLHALDGLDATDKIVRFEIGFCSAATVPTGTACGAAGCCPWAGVSGRPAAIQRTQRADTTPAGWLNRRVRFGMASSRIEWPDEKCSASRGTGHTFDREMSPVRREGGSSSVTNAGAAASTRKPRQSGCASSTASRRRRGTRCRQWATCRDGTSGFFATAQHDSKRKSRHLGIRGRLVGKEP